MPLHHIPPEVWLGSLARPQVPISVGISRDFLVRRNLNQCGCRILYNPQVLNTKILSPFPGPQREVWKPDLDGNLSASISQPDSFWIPESPRVSSGL